MALKAPVPGGSSYEVSYAADAGSRGSTLLIVIWIPNLPATVPAPQETTIAPAATVSLTGKVPAKSDARRMEIRVDLPDGTGSGTLTLSIDGEVHTTEAIAEDTTWTSLVHP